MKKIIVFILAVVALTTACSKYDNIVYENIPATLYLQESGVVALADFDVPYTVNVVKGGNATYDVNVEIAVATRALVSYNVVNAQNVALLPAECYELSVQSTTLAEDEYFAAFDIAFNVEQIALLAEGKYALPVEVRSENAYISDTKDVVLLFVER